MSGAGSLRLAVDGAGLARPLAGVGTYTRRLVTSMAEQRPSAQLTVHAPPGARLDGAGAGVDVLPAPTLRLLGRHALLPLAVRRVNAAAYLACTGSVPLGGVGCPALVTAHDLAIYRHPEWFPPGQGLSVKIVVPRSLRGADRVLAVSGHTARDVIELMGVPEERVRVVPLGVAAAFRPLPAEELVEARRRLGLPERFVLFLSTIEPRKNLPTLLDAWERLDPRPALVIAGGWGWRTDEIRPRLERAGEGVRLLGAVGPEDLPALYGLATCLAHPAWYEGFGLTPLEAMACGTPVVVSNASSLPEVVGDAARLVDPGDVEAWTAALAEVLDDQALRAVMRARGLRRAARLTWTETARRTWDAVDEVMR